MRLQYGNIHEKQWKLNKRGQKYLGFSLCPVGIPVDQLQQPQLAIAWNTSYKINFDPSCRSSGQKFEELTDDYWSVIHIKTKGSPWPVQGQAAKQWKRTNWFSVTWHEILKQDQQFIDMIYNDESPYNKALQCIVLDEQTINSKTCTHGKNTNMKTKQVQAYL